METPVKTFSDAALPDDFWARDDSSAPPLFMVNPKVHSVEIPQNFTTPHPGLICFSTSGSTGAPKWICHTRETLLASAGTVNRFLNSTAQDVWLRALPLFHVGGFGIEARAHLSEARVVASDAKWSPASFCELAAEQRITLASLVPTQVYDLVQGNHRSTASMRAVIIGGGRLDPLLKAAAKALGWPLLESYGMTETASQVATENDGGELELLDIWDAQDAGCLEVKGAALAKGKIVKTTEGWQFESIGEWLRTNDRVEVRGRILRWLGRADRVVKVLGELVDLDSVELECSHLAGHEVVVIGLPDERFGTRLVATELVASYQERCPPFARIQEVFDASLIKRSPLGKIMREETARNLLSSK